MTTKRPCRPCPKEAEPPPNETTTQQTKVVISSADDDASRRGHASALEGLSDDILAHSLLYSDFSSAVRFASGVTKNIRSRALPDSKDTSASISSATDKVQKSAFDKLWADIYNRHGFASISHGESSQKDILSETLRRRQLFDSLTGESRLRRHRSLLSAASSTSVNVSNQKKAIKQCLSLPNRYFHFVPLIPQLDIQDESDREMQEIMEEDPPPVDFGCESYALLPGTSPRLILMDPFDGTVSVHNHVLKGAVRSDEALMEDAFRAGADAIIRRRDNNTAAATTNDTTDINDNNGRDQQDIMNTQEEAETSADAIDREVQMNHNVARMERSQILHDIQDYFATDLAEYFVLPRDNIAAATNNIDDEQAIVMGEDDEVVVDWLGLDLHPIVTPTDGLVGNMVGAARVLTCETSAADAMDVAPGGSTTRSCMEVLGWKSTGGDDAKYDGEYVCRMTGFPNYVDIDARNDAVYATFAPGEGPRVPGVEPRLQAAAATNDDDDDTDLENLDLDWNGQPVQPSNLIVRYPLILKNKDDSNEAAPKTPRRRYFPQPDGYVQTRRPANSFVIDPTGNTLVVGTEGGCIEIWSTDMAQQQQQRDGNKMTRIQTLNLLQEIEAAKERERLANLRLKRLRSVSDVAPPEEEESIRILGTKDESMPDICEGDEEDTNVEMEDGSANDPNQEVAGAGEDEANGNGDSASSPLTQAKATGKIDSIYHPRHLEMHRAGFVTLQHHRTEGSTLALWQKPNMCQSVADPDEPYELSAAINLPLSSQRKPQVHYDGRRLIVFGQDHIGLIVLVYHVLSTWEDQDAFQSDLNAADETASSASRGEESGGVINLSPTTRRVRYANRIRHAGLGGCELYDPIYMTCNERFIVLNTKVGNLVGGDGGTNACEGLFVIDLEEKA